MASLSLKTAALMTRDEKALVRASEARSLAKLGEPVLRTQIERARHLRKKYDDLLQRQRSEAQSQRVPRGSRAAKGNSKTLLKVGAFTDALARFELESARRAGQIVPATRKTATRASKKTKAKGKRGAAASPSKASDRRDAPARSANGKVAPKKSGSKTTAPEIPRPKAQTADLRAKQNLLRSQRGPSMQQVGHAASRGRKVQARRDSIGARARSQRASPAR